MYKLFQNIFALLTYEQGSFTHAIMRLAISFVGLIALQKICLVANLTFSCPICQFFVFKMFLFTQTDAKIF